MTWSDKDLVLTGRTVGATGSHYHIAIHAPQGYDPGSASVNGEEAFLVSQKKNVWVIPVTGCGTATAWSVNFKKKRAQ